MVYLLVYYVHRWHALLAPIKPIIHKLYFENTGKTLMFFVLKSLRSFVAQLECLLFNVLEGWRHLAGREPSCTALRHCTAHYTATLHWGTALRHCTAHYTTALHCGTALRYCTGALHWGTALRYCTGALHCGSSMRHCTAALHCGTALRHFTASLNCGTALRHRTATLHCGTALRHYRKKRRKKKYSN